MKGSTHNRLNVFAFSMFILSFIISCILLIDAIIVRDIIIMAFAPMMIIFSAGGMFAFGSLWRLWIKLEKKRRDLEREESS